MAIGGGEGWCTLFQQELDKPYMRREQKVSLLLRVGLAIVFLYAGVASVLDGNDWIGYFPQFIRALLPAQVLLTAFSIYQCILALWILSGKKAFVSGLVACATLLAIIVFNSSLWEIVFRDVAIFFAALALAALHYPDGPSTKARI